MSNTSDVRKPIRIKPGEFGQGCMPCSEVCLHMRVAGRVMRFYVVAKKYPAVQLLNEDATPFSCPILMGEAGIFEDEDGFYYYGE